MIYYDVDTALADLSGQLEKVSPHGGTPHGGPCRPAVPGRVWTSGHRL